MSSEDENRVFIGGLARSITPVKLDKIFSRFGTVLETEIAVDIITDRSLGFGFVKFLNPKSVYDAIIYMDDSFLFGRRISVRPAYPRNPNYTHNNLYYRPSGYNCGGTGIVPQNCNAESESESSNESEYYFDPFGFYFDESDEFDESRYEDYTKFCDICKDFGHFIIHCPDWASSGRSMCDCAVGPLYEILTMGGYCMQCCNPRDPNPKASKPKNSQKTGGSSQSPKSEESSVKPAGESSVKAAGGSSDRPKNFKGERKSSPDSYNDMFRGMFNKKGVRGTGTSSGPANTGGSSLGHNNEKLENKSGGTRASGEKAAGGSGEKPTVVSSGKPTGGPTEKPTGGTSEKTTGGSIEKSTGGTGEKATGEPIEKAIGGTSEKATGGSIEKSTGGTGEKATGGSIEKAIGETSDKATGGCSRCRGKGIRLGRRRGKQQPVNVFVFVQRGEKLSKKVIRSMLGLGGAVKFAGL